MKLNAPFLVALGLSLSATLASAQPGPPGGPPGFRHPPVPPLILALDTNHDGVIDSNEIANASAALLTLDKNADGKLSADELRPRFADGTNQFRPPPFRGGKPPVSPVMAALDANGDGELDAAEIANASAALLALDKNGDGKLTREELAPRRPGHDASASGSTNAPPASPPDGFAGGPPEGAPDGPPDGPPPGGPEGFDGPPPDESMDNANAQ